MSRPIRWAVAALFLVAPLAGVTYAYPSWPTDVGLDVWNAPSLRAELEREQRQHDELENQLQQTARRRACKTAIALDLVAGRASLREAAIDFQAANADNSRFVPIMRLKFPAASELELHARNALDMACALLDHNPRRDEIRAHLTAELDALRTAMDAD